MAADQGAHRFLQHQRADDTEHDDIGQRDHEIDLTDAAQKGEKLHARRRADDTAGAGGALIDGCDAGPRAFFRYALSRGATTANTFTRPLFTCGTNEAVVTSDATTSPPSKAVVAGPAPPL